MRKPLDNIFQPVHALCGRMLQVVFSSMLLVLLSPILLISIIAIWIESGRPALFRQERLGKGKKPFTIYKLRTMRQGVELHKSATGDSFDETEYITRIGGMLRLTKIDEIPQFINILKGDMNIVGPRPLRNGLSRQCIETIPGFDRRYAIKPGLTGICQVIEREGFDLRRDGLQYEIDYTENKRPILDMLIVLLTVDYIAKLVLTWIHQKLLSLAIGSYSHAHGERIGSSGSQ